MYRLIIENERTSETIFKAETREKLLTKAVNYRRLHVENQRLRIVEDELPEELDFFTPSNMNHA